MKFFSVFCDCSRLFSFLIQGEVWMLLQPFQGRVTTIRSTTFGTAVAEFYESCVHMNKELKNDNIIKIRL